MYGKLKKLCCKWNLELPRLGLVLYTFGNVSCADHQKRVFAIKPSGVPYEDLSEDMIVVMDFDGKILDGRLRPSSDAPTHAELYRSFPGLGGIVHTHSTYATAWAQALRDVPLYGTTHADHLATPIPCTEMMADERIRGDYEVETARQIVNTFAKRKLNPAEVQMVLVGGHGPFTWGSTPEKAVYHARVLEELAKMALLTERINPKASPLKKAIVEKHYQRKHGKDAYYGQR
ncbi:MAG: L-ribulose-5-phosphate 4-epimerase AraD [Victivallaceae bacterium]|nr:L-ribulose-5-phosphate 4-epimerase AraD [Victivallaceae bacterium]